MCGRASPIYDSGNSYNEQRISRVRVTFSNLSEMRTKCGTSRNAVRGTRTRMDPGERRQRGRKKGKGSLYFTRRHAHVERGMQMCTKRREHFAARCSRACPALFPSSPVLLPSCIWRPPTSRGLTPGRAHAHVHTYIPFLRRRLTGGFRVAQPRRPPPPVPQHSTIGRSVGPSVPRHYFARGAEKRGKSCLRRMNKILFSPRTANASPVPHRRALGRPGMLWKVSRNRDLDRRYITKRNAKVIITT